MLEANKPHRHKTTWQGLQVCHSYQVKLLTGPIPKFLIDFNDLHFQIYNHRAQVRIQLLKQLDL